MRICPSYGPIPSGLFFMNGPSYVLGYRFGNGFVAAFRWARFRRWRINYIPMWVSPCKWDAPPPARSA